MNMALRRLFYIHLSVCIFTPKLITQKIFRLREQNFMFVLMMAKNHSGQNLNQPIFLKKYFTISDIEIHWV